MIEDYINTVVSVPDSQITPDWFRLLYMRPPVTRTEVILYLNEWEIDAFVSVGESSGDFFVWIKREDILNAIQHYDKFMEWQQEWMSLERK